MEVATKGVVCGLSVWQLVSCGADECDVRVIYGNDGEGAGETPDGKILSKGQDVP